jgi:hypothetical protein
VSEYQYVAFRAIDAPVSASNLAYMRRQSMRARITAWSFTNEYHFGYFRGDAMAMLRRGYDIHLHYANFGTRALYIRLPHGFPEPRAAANYLDGDALRFQKDPDGEGGILEINPCFEPGDCEEIWDLDDWLDALIPLREEILRGDLRPLYLAHLAVSRDQNHDPDETVEGPLPAAMGKLTAAQRKLADFYELSDALLAAAAEGAPDLPAADDAGADYVRWLARLPTAVKDQWLAAFMKGSGSSVRARLLAQYQSARPESRWPTVARCRTMAQLDAAAAAIEEQMKRKAAADAKRRRAERFEKMRADPSRYLRETEELVATRMTNNYCQAARILADLRQALAGTERCNWADKQAQRLKQKHPTLNRLKAALREKGFIPRPS